MDLIERPLILTDLETTGLDPIIHEVIDIGAVRVNQYTLEEEDSFSMRIQPLHIETAHPKALEVNGYNPEEWADALPPSQAWPSFFAFAEESLFSSWSTSFEWGFIKPSIDRFYLKAAGKERFGPFDRHLIDLPSVAWAILGPMNSLSKDAVAEKLWLAKENSTHRGLAGARHALENLRELRRLARSGWIFGIPEHLRKENLIGKAA